MRAAVLAIPTALLVACGGDGPAEAPGSGWSKPACAAVSGPAGATFTMDGGRSVAALAWPRSGETTVDLALLVGLPDTLLAIADRVDPDAGVTASSSIVVSRDAGCTWTALASLAPDEFDSLTAGSADEAFAWRLKSNAFALVRADGSVERRPTASSNLWVGADPRQVRALRRIDAELAVWRSDDGGTSWQQVGSVPHHCCKDDDNHAEVAMPTFDRLVVGTGYLGSRSDDGGRTWRELVDFRYSEITHVAIPPTRPDEIWIRELNWVFENFGMARPYRCLWMSRNGGASFVRVSCAEEPGRFSSGHLLPDPEGEGVASWVGREIRSGYRQSLHEASVSARGRVALGHQALPTGEPSSAPTIDYGCARRNPDHPEVIYLGVGSPGTMDGCR